MTLRYRRHPVETRDGWRLALYRATSRTPRVGRPVLLLPGANSNHLGFGQDPARSLPGVLRARGMDVWLLDFRGSRSSRYAGNGDPSGPSVTLDLKLQHDLPAALDSIRQETGSERVDLVGHSLGGTLVYLHAGGAGRDEVGRVVTVNSPATFRDFFGLLSPLLRGPASALAPFAARLSGLGVDRLVRIPGLGRALSRKHFRKGSLTLAEREAWFARAVEDMAGGELAQLMLWIGERRLVDMNGGDYEERLARVRAPVLVLAAAGDLVIPEAAVREGFERLGTEEKEFRLLGRAHGDESDYAHSDVLLAPSAARDVHPKIAEWLEAEAIRSAT